jgi:arabinosaccharide transport system substrate-binding protein
LASRAIETFPYGKAPFWLLALAVVSTLVAVVTQSSRAASRADLVFATFAKNHLESYQGVARRFERKHGVKVTLEVVHNKSLETRLQNAMLAGTDVPDLAEIGAGAISFFTRGPLSDVGLVDFTDRLEQEGLRKRLVESRLSLWSTRGRVFALPHDVHPVALVYRADLVEELGIDVSRIETWDDFVALGPKVVKDLDGDGVMDRYLIDLPMGAAWGVQILLLQQGVSLFDEHGKVAFDQPLTVDTIAWYLHQIEGKTRVAAECGWGQSLMKAMLDGLALFYLAPDWRTHTIITDVPKARGKLRVMPLPAWKPGGRRTSTWGGTGLVITKSTKQPELAWELAKALYFDPAELGPRFALTNILPPLSDAWSRPEFQRRDDYYGGQKVGALFAKLAPETPPDWSTPYKTQAETRLAEVFLRSLEHFKRHGDDGLRDAIQRELTVAREYLEAVMGRNVQARR